METKEVFICYRGNSTDALSVGAQIHTLLEYSKNIRCFYAPYTIKKGEDFKKILFDVFKEVKIVVLLLSENFFNMCLNDDDIVLFELQEALKNANIKFLPIVFKNFNYSNENLSLFTQSDIDRFKHINAFEYYSQYSFDFEAVTRTICDLMSNQMNRDKNQYRVKENIDFNDMKDAVQLVHPVFNDIQHVGADKCWEWFRDNQSVYIFIENKAENKIVAYMVVAPITDECYEKIRSRQFLITNITNDMLLSFDIPSPYSMCLFPMVVHPEHINAELVSTLLNALADKLVKLVNSDVYVKQLIADAITNNDKRLCKLFGMTEIGESMHKSMLYEVKMIPPSFKKMTPKLAELFDCYEKAYKEKSYLFDGE